MYTISYTNPDGLPITYQQSTLLEEYCKVFSLENDKKIIEHYNSGSLELIEYYKTENESLEDILAVYNLDILQVISYENINQYVVEFKTVFSTGIPIIIEKSLFFNNKLICYQEFNNDGTIDHQFSKKIHHLIDDEELYFYYESNNNIESIGGTPFPFSEFNQRLELDEFESYFPNFIVDHPYYADATFLPTDTSQPV